MDGIVKGRPALQNHIEDAMKENEMIPVGWNRQSEASNIEQYSGLSTGPLEEEMISIG